MFQLKPINTHIPSFLCSVEGKQLWKSDINVQQESNFIYDVEKKSDWSFSRSNQSCGSKGRALEINSAVIGQQPQHVRTRFRWKVKTGFNEVWGGLLRDYFSKHGLHQYQSFADCWNLTFSDYQDLQRAITSEKYKSNIVPNLQISVVRSSCYRCTSRQQNKHHSNTVKIWDITWWSHASL